MNELERKELISYRIKRANDTLNEIELLVENQLWNTAVNRLYYACYYAVIALLVKNKIEAQTHGGVRQMFGLHFIKTGLIDKELGKYYSDIFDKRQTGDYDDFVDYIKEDVIELITPAKQLLAEIEKLVE
ncbi:MAG: HEPN domain-containing protein [Bacteroidales bacterium]|nr:HEPN domain-containing protein [Bacteroidales bacterium]